MSIALIALLRTLPNYRLTPLLQLTTESSPERKMQAKQTGATGWMVKPFDPINWWSRSSACWITRRPRVPEDKRSWASLPFQKPRSSTRVRREEDRRERIVPSWWEEMKW
jgi:DNA-binding response OmpR family regulator